MKPNQTTTPRFRQAMPVCLIQATFILLLLTGCPAPGKAQQAPDSTAPRLLDQARQLRDKGALREALAHADELLRRQEQYTGAGSLETACIHEFIGETFAFAGNPGLAVLKLRQTLSIREKHLDSLDVDIAQCHLLIGNHLRETGKIAEAQASYQRGIEILVRRSDDQRSNLAVFYNNFAFCFESTKPDSCLRLLQRALVLRQESLGADHPEVGTSHMNIGSALKARGQLDSARHHALKSVRIFRMHAPDENNHNLGKAYSNVGSCYGEWGRTDSAEAYFLRAVRVLKAVLGERHPDVAQVYNNLATFTGSDVMKSRAYLRAALDILEDSEFDARSTRINVMGNLAENHAAAREYEQALAWGKQALDLHPMTVPDYTLGVLLSNMGNYYAGLSNFDSALLYYRRAHAAYPPDNSYGIANTLGNMATLFLSHGHADSAYYYFSKILAPLSAPVFPTNVNQMDNLASTCLALGKDSLALAWATRAWQIWSGTPEMSHVEDKLICLNVLGGVYLTRYKFRRNANDLELARQYFRQGMALARTFSFQKAEYEDLAATVKWIIQLAENGIQAELRAFEQSGDPQAPANAWEYAEQTKAILLHNVLLESRAARFAGLPDSTAQELIRAKHQMLWLEKRQLEQAAKPQAADSLDLRFAAEALVARTRLNDLNALVEKQYPEYHRLRFGGLNTLSLAEAAASLAPDQCIVSYFTGDSTMYAFVVSTHATRFLQIKKDFPLDDWVQKLRAGIYDYHSLPAGRRTPELYRQTTEQYTEYGRKLYQKLVAPLQPWLSGRVVFVPDGVLATLPFELLLTDASGSAKDFGTLPYLLKKHRIGYAYSATSFREMQTRKHRRSPTRELLALAPFATRDTLLLHFGPNGDGAPLRRALLPLPRSGEEAEAVRRIFGGDALLGSVATVEAFLERCGEYRLLHLATHAQADQHKGNRAHLAFAAPPDSSGAGVLFISDLYGTALNADLVVLSACESGIGKLQHGDGPVSIARAFAAAGAKSIVHSLWVVSDAATTRLMEEFYGTLREGTTKDAALRTAKMTYLAAAAPRYRHPFFWAGFVATGDMSALRQE